MIENFPYCVAIILREEGGNDDDPRDHGGRTSRGITQREYDIWRKDKPQLPPDVWKAPQAEIEAIYKEQYWDPYCDKLPAGLDLEFFNGSVNSGRTQAVRELQRALGVSVDGMMGIATLNAIASTPLLKLVHDYAEQRRAFYKALKQFPIYGKGWMSRTDRVEASATKMAQGQPVSHPPINTQPAEPQVTVSAKADPRATLEPPVSVQTATAGTAAGGVLGGVSDQLNTVSTAIQPLADTFLYIKYACIGITVICAGLAIYAVIRNNWIAKVV